MEIITASVSHRNAGAKAQLARQVQKLAKTLEEYWRGGNGPDFDQERDVLRRAHEALGQLSEMLEGV